MWSTGLVMAPVKQTDSVLNLLKERMVSLEGYTGLILIFILLKEFKIFHENPKFTIFFCDLIN